MRMMNKKRFLAGMTALVLLGGGILAGCSKKPAPAPAPASAPEVPKGPSQGGTLTVGLRTMMETFDVINATHLNAPALQIYDTLVTLDDSGTFQPGLAEKWDVAPDGKTITFTLKKDVKFHDGTEFTSESVKWFVEKLRTGIDAYMVTSVESVDTPDAQTAVFKLKGPDPNLFWNLATIYCGIPSPTAYEKAGEDYGVKVAVGTGPFKLEEFVTGDRVVLSKNPEYGWGPEWRGNTGPAYLDKIVYRFIPEDSSRIMELQSGGIDVLENIPPHQVSQFKDDKEFQALEKEGVLVVIMGMNPSIEPFNDINLRKAVNMAIDKESIAKSLYYGVAKPAWGMLPSALSEGKDFEQFGYKYDVSGAKRLLETAGYKDTNGDGIVEKNGKPLKITLGSYTETEYSKLAEAIQNQLKAIGIDAGVQTLDALAFEEYRKKGDWQCYVAFSSWANADILDWWFSSKNAPWPNHYGWKDTTTDSIIEKAFTVPTWDERVAAFTELHKYLLDKAIWAPVVEPKALIVTSSKVKEYNMVFGQHASMVGVWLDDSKK